MTESITTTTPRHQTTASAPAERMLRGVLGVNAVTSLAVGVVGVIAARWLSRELGIDHVAWTRIVSAGLIVFALGVAAVAAANPARLRTGAAAVSVVDLAWVAGTVVVLAAVSLTGWGQLVAVVQGVGVLGFAAGQLWFRSHLAR